MINKKWENIEGFNDYLVSNYGEIYSKKSKIIMKSSLNSDGYKQLRIGGISFKVHKLVATAFLNHKSSGQNRGLVIDHIDRNRSNNHILNLREVSPRNNRLNYTTNKAPTSKFTGVCWDKSRNKWFASIKIDSKQKNLGRFDCEIEASNAYLSKLKQLNE